MELEANIFRVFISLWYLPLVKISKKSMRWWWHALDNLAWNYPMKNFFLLATVAMIAVKMFLPIFIAAVVRETYSFNKIMQPISPNYNWENGVKQIKITEENCITKLYLVSIAKDKRTRSTCTKQFLFILTTIPLTSGEWMWFI